MTHARAHEDVPREPGEGFVAGLELRGGAEINQCGIHGFPATQPLHGFGGAVPEAGIFDVDSTAVRRFDDIARLQLRHPVRAYELIVCPRGKHTALESRARDFAAENRDHAPHSCGRTADLDGLAHHNTQIDGVHQFNHGRAGARLISVSSLRTPSTIRFATNSAECAGGKFRRIAAKSGAGKPPLRWVFAKAFLPKFVSVKYGSTTSTLIPSPASSALA